MIDLSYGDQVIVVLFMSIAFITCYCLIWISEEEQEEEYK